MSCIIRFCPHIVDFSLSLLHLQVTRISLDV